MCCEDSALVGYEWCGSFIQYYFGGRLQMNHYETMSTCPCVLNCNHLLWTSYLTLINWLMHSSQLIKWSLMAISTQFQTAPRSFDLRNCFSGARFIWKLFVLALRNANGYESHSHVFNKIKPVTDTLMYIYHLPAIHEVLVIWNSYGLYILCYVKVFTVLYCVTTESWSLIIRPE